MGKGWENCGWREAVGLGDGQCRISHSMDSALGREIYGKVWAELGSRAGRRVRCPCMKGAGNRLGAAAPGAPGIQQCPGERGLWGRDLGKMDVAVLDAQHQHLLSLELPAGGVFNEFLIPLWKSNTWRGCRFRSVPTWQPGVVHPRPVVHPRQVILQDQ